MDKFTWRDLLGYMAAREKTNPGFLDSPVLTCNGDGEFQFVDEIYESEEDDIIDDGTPYLQLIED